MLTHDVLGATVATSKATDYIATEPRTCPHCGMFTQWFRNVSGATACIHCVKEEPDAGRPS